MSPNHQICSTSFSHWIAGAAMLGAIAAAWPLPVFAYRPFDGTDAAVAELGEIEIELQPAGVMREGGETTLIAPAAIINIGFEKHWELVLQGQGQFPLSNSEESASFAGAGVFLKHVLRPGSLQGGTGPSVAIEFGPLLPGIRADPGTGASFAGIVSQRWDEGTIHLNMAAALTRDHYADVFLGAIVEGPSKWPVRPVAEIFYEEKIGQSHTISGLVGAIWQLRDNFSFDVGLRHAITNGNRVDEVRVGLTFGFPLSLLGGAGHK